jgi:hypothetical protein
MNERMSWWDVLWAVLGLAVIFGIMVLAVMFGQV